MEWVWYIIVSIGAGIGTGTFIMTFTALIASVSHIMILLNYWSYID